MHASWRMEDGGCMEDVYVYVGKEDADGGVGGWRMEDAWRMRT